MKFHHIWNECIRCIFYEGQVLFSESMHDSAEVKFTIVLCMINIHVFSYPSVVGVDGMTIIDLLLRSSSAEKSFHYLQKLKVACLINIVTCRIKRQYVHARESVSLPFVGLSKDNIVDETVTLIVESDAITLCGYAESICKILKCSFDDTVVIKCRKLDLLESMKEYERGLELVVQMLSELDVPPEESVQDCFIQRFNGECIFTQKFICGFDLEAASWDVIKKNQLNRDDFLTALKQSLSVKMQRIDFLAQSKSKKSPIV